MQLLARQRAGPERRDRRGGGAIERLLNLRNDVGLLSRGIRPPVWQASRQHAAGVQPRPARPDSPQPQQSRRAPPPWSRRRAPQACRLGSDAHHSSHPHRQLPQRSPAGVRGRRLALGTDIIGRALKASGGFHVTIGQRSVLRVVYAFARRPSMYHGRTAAAAAVIRDAFAQGWQVSASSCLDCAADCRAAAGLTRTAWARAWSSGAWSGTATPARTSSSAPRR